MDLAKINHAPRSDGPGVDLDAQTGLRGLAALHVMVFHCLMFSTLNIDIQGSSTMALFYLLSGFSLTVVYGRQQAEPESILWFLGCHSRRPDAGGEDNDDSGATSKRLNPWTFYQNRIARVIPLHYLCNLLAVPFVVAGYTFISNDQLWASALATVFPASSFFGFFPCPNPCGPSWTVCTLMVMWLHFPYVLPIVQRLTTAQLVQRINQFHLLQCLLAVVIFVPLLPLMNAWMALFFATAHPWSRMPVFLMGCCAGILRLRAADDPENNNNKQTAWPSLWPSLVCFCCLMRPSSLDSSDQWAALTDRAALMMLGWYAIPTVISFAGINVLGALWLQVLVALFQLTMAMGLTMDEGKSRLSKVCMWRPVQYCGKISMAIYLVHMNVLEVFHVLLLDPPVMPGGKRFVDLTNDELLEMVSQFWLPLWCTPAIIAGSLVCASLLHHLVENPCRKWLRSKRPAFE